jgi:antitoxin component YwqK of YwqJK toxin-antitoxin module
MRTLHLLPFFLLLACGGSKAQQPAPGASASESKNPVYRERPAEDGLILVEVDLNDDGVIDVYNYYRERAKAARLLVRKEIDLNHDARIDVWSFFDETGELIREDMDGDFDGKVDWVDHYQTSKRAMSEVDTNYDGQMDMFKYFENGVLTRKERDTNSNGQIDFWELFDEQGRVVKTGRDTTGDGIMDTRD